MIRSGRVVESGNGEIKVCFDRPEMCEKCGACTGKAHKELICLKGNAKAGDTVDVEMPDARILKASALAYVIPLIGLLVGVLIGQFVIGGDAAAAVCGIVGLALSWGALHLADGKLASKNKWQPQVVAVHEQKEGKQHE